MEELVIGIDLGTTNCCVCVYLNGALKILENSEGGRTTPSFVFFTEQNAAIIGQYAKRMADAKPEYGIYEIKRLIGRQYDDPYVKKNLSYLPFDVKSIDNQLVICLQNRTNLIKKRPQELCTYILSKLKRDTEDKLGEEIKKAVITVPAYFNIAQREATLQAAFDAGFTVLKLLNEPTAAALTYYYQKQCPPNSSFSLVYDLGGGTFDVAILRKEDSRIDIVGVDGDSHLGGHDFDNLLVEFACNYLIQTHNYNPKGNRRNMRRLHNECEEAKKILSVCEETTIILNAFVMNPPTIEIHITRRKFEELAATLFKQTIEIVKRCLTKAALSKGDIKEVILTGGSTRIPKIQALMEEYFDGRSLSKFVNPDECVAEGAAIQAALLSCDPRQHITAITITDVTPLSLGISNFVDAMTFLIKSNTPIPASHSTKRVTVYDKQTHMTFDIYEGERLDARKNNFLGQLAINDLTPAPPGLCSVTVKMAIDQNGILTVSATETISNVTKDVKIAYTRGTRSDAEVKKVIVDARANAVEDAKFEKFAQLKGYVIKYCVRCRSNFEKKCITTSNRSLYEKCSDVLVQVKYFDTEDLDKLQHVKNKITKELDPIVKKFKFENMPFL